MTKPRCENCRFWDHYDGEIGMCRRNPPERGEDDEGVWPQTYNDSWCGEFQPKDDTEERR